MSCFDERPCFLLEDGGGRLPLSPGKAKRSQYEYHQKGACCVLLALEPHPGLRSVEGRESRTVVDYADFRQTLLARYSPQVESLRLVQDTLNTPTPGSFSEGLPPEQAFTLAQGFEPPYPPKEGSWLTMAEIEFAALSKHCLDRRLPDVPSLRTEVLAWSNQRNQARETVKWQFAQPAARKKLHRHYQNVQKFT